MITLNQASPYTPSPYKKPKNEPKNAIFDKVLFAANSNVDLEKLNISFVADLTEFCKTFGYKFFITSGYRSVEKQATLYNQSILNGTPGKLPNGNPVAKPNKSKHNKGKAIDLGYNSNSHINMKKLIQDLELFGFSYIKEKTCLHIEDCESDFDELYK